MDTIQVSATSFHTLISRVSAMEGHLGLEPSLITLPISAASWDAVLARVAALEDNLLAADDQPTAEDLSESQIEAEYSAWSRVNGTLGTLRDIAAWTRHFAQTRHLGVA